MLLTFFLALIFFNVAAQTPEQEAERWSKKLFKALKKEKVERVVSFFYDEQDIVSLEEQLNSARTLQYDVEEVYKVFEKSKRKHVELLFLAGNDEQVNWRKLKVKETSYREVRTFGTDGQLLEAVFIYYVSDGTHDFEIVLKPIVYMNGEWHLSDYIFLEFDHQH